MPVFDFSNPESTTTTTEVTYTTFHSDKNVATPEDPILLLDNAPRQWAHHSCGVFTNPAKHTAFEFEEEDGIISANILQIDSRFVSLIKWLGENHINVRLSGKNQTVMQSTKFVKLPMAVPRNYLLKTVSFSL